MRAIWIRCDEEAALDARKSVGRLSEPPGSKETDGLEAYSQEVKGTCSSTHDDAAAALDRADVPCSLSTLVQALTSTVACNILNSAASTTALSLGLTDLSPARASPAREGGVLPPSPSPRLDEPSSSREAKSTQGDEPSPPASTRMGEVLPRGKCKSMRGGASEMGLAVAALELGSPALSRLAGCVCVRRLTLLKLDNAGFAIFSGAAAF